MILATSRRDLETHYNCFLEKESKCNPPLWWLKGLEVVMSGGDAYDEIHDLAVGDSPEELLLWASVQGLHIADDAGKILDKTT